MAILEEDRDCVPAMLVLSAMFTLQAHDTKSRNMLKRIAKMPHAYESGASFEHAYLVLAGFYIAKKKYDLAQVRRKDAFNVISSTLPACFCRCPARRAAGRPLPTPWR